MNSSDGNSTNLWVFGYGSLCWLQGFDYGSQQLGFIRGFSRKFWQGNNTHRGTQDKVRILMSFLYHCVSSVHFNLAIVCLLLSIRPLHHLI